MLPNPVMWIKFVLVALAIVNMRLITHGVFRELSTTSTVPPRGKVLAVTSLVLWGAAIVAGRLTAYIGQ
jgi:hypothetical protein